MRSGRAFTLIEVIVVIVIIMILAGIIIPAVGAARHRAREVQCTTNLLGIGKLLERYRSDYAGYGKAREPVFLIAVLNATYNEDPELYLCPLDDSRGQRGPWPPGGKYLEVKEVGLSYLYEFNGNALCDWAWDYVTIPGLTGEPGFDEQKFSEYVDIGQPNGDPNPENKTTWNEAKLAQLRHGDKFINADPSNPGMTLPSSQWHGYPPSWFPIVRCFWHAPSKVFTATDKEQQQYRDCVLNLSYAGNVFRSGLQWETATVNR